MRNGSHLTAEPRHASPPRPKGGQCRVDVCRCSAGGRGGKTSCEGEMESFPAAILHVAQGPVQ